MLSSSPEEGDPAVEGGESTAGDGEIYAFSFTGPEAPAGGVAVAVNHALAVSDPSTGTSSIARPSSREIAVICASSGEGSRFRTFPRWSC